jgi:HAD superfamily hydrolase (TIGR01458 family)
VPLSTRPKGLLLDLDGTVYTEEGLIAGADRAVRALREAGVLLRFVTNTTRVPRSTIAAWLRDYGIEARTGDVFTPPLAAAEWLRRSGLRRVALFLPVHTFVEFEGLEIVEEDPEAVVIGDLGSGWTFEVLNHAFRWILGGAEFLALHRNRYWLTAGGLALDVGAFAAALEYATGRTARLVGKPSRPMFAAAAGSMGLDIPDVAMVGDDLESDIAGIHECGGVGIMVRTGKFREEELAGSDVAPELVIDSIANLPVHLSQLT